MTLLSGSSLVFFFLSSVPTVVDTTNLSYFLLGWTFSTKITLSMAEKTLVIGCFFFLKKPRTPPHHFSFTHVWLHLESFGTLMQTVRAESYYPTTFWPIVMFRSIPNSDVKMWKKKYILELRKFCSVEGRLLITVQSSAIQSVPWWPVLFCKYVIDLQRRKHKKMTVSIELLDN